jgi:hypothetical protein
MCNINHSNGLPYEQIPDKFNPVKDLVKKLPPDELLKRLKERKDKPGNDGEPNKQQEEGGGKE